MSQKLNKSMGSSEEAILTTKDYNQLNEEFNAIFNDKDIDPEVDSFVQQIKYQLIDNSKNINECPLLKKSLKYCIKKLYDLSTEQNIRQSKSWSKTIR